MSKVYQSTRGVEKFNNVGQSNVTFDFDGRNEFNWKNRLIKEGTFKEVVDYLTFTNNGNTTGTAKFKTVGTFTELPVIEYSLDDGDWTSYTFGNAISVPSNKSIKWRGNNSFFSESNAAYISAEFGSGNTFAVSGNIMTLLDKTGELLTLPCDDCFNRLFNECTQITSIPDLPATTLTQRCYNMMFYGCTGLTSITNTYSLPAMNLISSCYSYMFYGCTGLTTLPENLLPATTLAVNCYSNMFYGCTELTTPCTLPASIASSQCYSNMFRDCTKLVSLPIINFTTFASSSCGSMFAGCSLIKMSETQTGEYVNAYTFKTIPSSSYTNNMFGNTGGTFTGTPTAQTYYTSNTIIE